MEIWPAANKTKHQECYRYRQDESMYVYVFEASLTRTLETDVYVVSKSLKL